MKNNEFDKNVTEKEIAAWLSLKEVIRGFLGNHKAENTEFLVKDLLQNYETERVQNVFKNTLFAFSYRSWNNE